MSDTTPTTAEIAIDAVPAVTAGIKFGDDVLLAAKDVFDLYQRSDMQLSAVQKERLDKAKAILATVQSHNTGETQGQLGSLSGLLIAVLIAIGAIVSLAGCSGLTVKPGSYTPPASIDSTTPKQFNQDSSGFVDYHDSKSYLSKDGKTEENGKPISGIVFGVLTSNGVDAYNRSMVKYASLLQFYWNIAPVPKDAGVTPFTDEYGNSLHAIDAQHLEYMLHAADIATNPQLYPTPTTAPATAPAAPKTNPAAKPGS